MEDRLEDRMISKVEDRLSTIDGRRSTVDCRQNDNRRDGQTYSDLKTQCCTLEKKNGKGKEEAVREKERKGQDEKGKGKGKEEGMCDWKEEGEIEAKE